jgi:hypothetical protein
VAEERAERGLDRRRRHGFAASLGSDEPGGLDTDRRAFDIAFAAGYLPGEADVGLDLRRSS